MIKAKELMLDDWVLAYGKKTQVVWTGNVKKLAVQGFPSEFFEDEILPIPITPEILEQNGFELKPDGWLWSNEGLEDQNYIFIQFRKVGEGVRNCEINFIHREQFTFKQMYFVHELQHALRLCGINKNIEL